jgi:hypothetical protein
VYFRSRIEEERDVASWVSVMDKSRGERRPLDRGMERTSRVLGGGREERSQGLGMRDWRSDCLRAAIAFQGGSVAIVRDLMDTRRALKTGVGDYILWCC